MDNPESQPQPTPVHPAVAWLKKFGVTGFIGSFLLLGGIGMCWDGFFGGTYTEAQYHTFEGSAVRDLGTVRLADKHGEYNAEQRAELRNTGLILLAIGGAMVGWKLLKMRELPPQ